jgi:hypothetical protein
MLRGSAYDHNRLTNIKNSQHDKPRIASFKQAVSRFGQPAIRRNRYVLHGDGMIDVPADYTDPVLISRDNDVAMAGEMVCWQLPVFQWVPVAGKADDVTCNRRVVIHALRDDRPA